ncbi:MAG: hypothetical protein Q7W16_08660 [Coriobacteriia bacterium]|nr:hypothetical protein [Coriobacteriia bacterium]
MARPDLSPRSVGRLLDDAIAIYRANFRSIVTVAAITVFPLALIYGVSQTLYLRGLTDMFARLAGAPTGSVAGPEPDATMLIGYVLTAAMSLGYMLARVYFQSTLLRAGSALLEGRPPGTRQMLKDGVAVALPVFGVTMLVSLAVSTAAGVTLLLLGAGGAVVAAYLAVSVPVAAIEGAGVIDALKRSFVLVRGNVWRVVLVTLGMLVLSSQIEGALASPIIVRDIVLGMQNPTTVVTQLPLAWKVAEGFLQAGAAVLVLPFIELTWLCCYLDLRARNEGLDLLVRAQDLTAGSR